MQYSCMIYWLVRLVNCKSGSTFWLQLLITLGEFYFLFHPQVCLMSEYLDLS